MRRSLAEQRERDDYVGTSQQDETGNGVKNSSGLTKASAEPEKLLSGNKECHTIVQHSSASKSVQVCSAETRERGHVMPQQPSVIAFVAQEHLPPRKYKHQARRVVRAQDLFLSDNTNLAKKGGFPRIMNWEKKRIRGKEKRAMAHRFFTVHEQEVFENLGSFKAKGAHFYEPTVAETRIKTQRMEIMEAIENDLRFLVNKEEKVMERVTELKQRIAYLQDMRDKELQREKERYRRDKFLKQRIEHYYQEKAYDEDIKREQEAVLREQRADEYAKDLDRRERVKEEIAAWRSDREMQKQEEEYLRQLELEEIKMYGCAGASDSRSDSRSPREWHLQPAVADKKPLFAPNLRANEILFDHLPEKSGDVIAAQRMGTAAKVDKTRDEVFLAGNNVFVRWLCCVGEICGDLCLILHRLPYG